MRAITLALGLLAAAQVAVGDGQNPDPSWNQSPDIEVNGQPLAAQDTRLVQ
jgi:hypothetical protein